MLLHPTLQKLQTLNLGGMLRALQEQQTQPEYAQLSFEERLGLLVDCELLERENRRLAVRLKRAQLRQTAVMEDLDFRHPRGLERSVILNLATCRWLSQRQNCLITGPTGIGKTYLACALSHKACREGYSVHYARASRLLQDLAVARADGSYTRQLRTLARIDLLVLDDWGLATLTPENRRDLLELLDDRYECRSTLITSQLPVDKWYEYLGDPTLADAILDRLIHNAHRVNLTGESLRKSRTRITEPQEKTDN